MRMTRRNFLRKVSASGTLMTLGSPFEIEALLEFIDQNTSRGINYNGLEMELAYQKELKEKEKSRKGANLIVLCDDGKGTGLYIGNIRMAAKTLGESLAGKIVTKQFYNDSSFIDYLINPDDIEPDQKFKNVFWFGHGDAESFWMDLTFKDDHCYLDETDLLGIGESLETIRNRFTEDAVFKSYTCHPCADNTGSVPIGVTISKVFNVDFIGANSWVFSKGIMRDGKLRVFYYPATREDYRVEFKTLIPDPYYTGKSKWVLIKK